MFHHLDLKRDKKNKFKKIFSLTGKILEWFIFTVIVLAFLAVASPYLPSRDKFHTYIVASGSMEPKIMAGSVALVKLADSLEIKVNDVIAFSSPHGQKQTILHRVKKISKENGNVTFLTKGDNNNSEDNWEVPAANIQGTMISAIPYLGHISAMVKTPYGFIVLVGIPAAYLLFLQIKQIKKGIEEEVEKRFKAKIMVATLVLALIGPIAFIAGGYRLISALFVTSVTVAGISFSVKDFVAPPFPELILPLNNSFRNTSGMVMDWSDVSDYENMSLPVYYIYQSARNSGFSPLAYQSGHLSNSQIPAPGTPDGEYWWRVKTCDAIDNCSLWSTAFKVTVDSTAPSSPSWVTPADNSYTNQSQNILLDWSDSLDANLSGYEYENTGPGGTWKSVDSCGLLTQSQIPNSQIGPGGSCINAPAGTLSVDGSYFRKVRAKDKTGNYSNWSSIFKLTRDTAVPSSIFITPSENVDFLTSPINVSGTSTDNYTVDYVNLYFSQYSGGACSSDWTNITAIDNPANNSPFSWNYSWTPPATGNYCLKARASDLAGNTEASPVVENVRFFETPVLTASRTDEGKLVQTKISGLTGYSSYNYQIIFKHDGPVIGGVEGYSGTVNLAGEDESSRSFVLGFCSSDGCTYYENVNDLTVDINVYTPGGSVIHLSKSL